MPKDRDQQTPADADDAQRLATSRGQGTAGTGRDLLPGEGGGPTGVPEEPSEESEDGELPGQEQLALQADADDEGSGGNPVAAEDDHD